MLKCKIKCFHCKSNIGREETNSPKITIFKSQYTFTINDKEEPDK